MKMIDPETREMLRGIQTEIGAGKCLIIHGEAEVAHNNACDRAIKIIQNYRDDIGLFQMKARRKAAK
jgi:hypothetical protein